MDIFLWILLGFVIGVFLVAQGVNKWKQEALIHKGITSTLSLVVKSLDKNFATYNNLFAIICDLESKWINIDNKPPENILVLFKIKTPASFIFDLGYLDSQEKITVYRYYDMIDYIVEWKPLPTENI